jgi:hypothetical protein
MPCSPASTTISSAYRALAARVARERGHPAHFDIVHEGTSPGSDRERALALVEPYAEAGVTWWLESAWARLIEPPHDVERLRERIRAGPPRR